MALIYLLNQCSKEHGFLINQIQKALKSMRLMIIRDLLNKSGFMI